MDVQPFERTGLLTRAAPFLLAITAAFALTPMQPYGSRAQEILYAVVVASAIIAAVAFVPWKRLPRFAQSAPALGFFGVVALLSGAGGGPSSVYAPLVFLPVVWIALYGERWELGFAILGVAATFLGPLVRSDHYPATEWGAHSPPWRLRWSWESPCRASFGGCAPGQRNRRARRRCFGGASSTQ